MKKKRTLFVLFVMLILSMSLVIGQTAAQTTGPNLLTNPGFEGGHYNQDGIAEITVPNGWRMHWVDGVSFPGAWDDLPANRPETVVWNSAGGIPVGEEFLWRDGAHVLKLFKSWAPMYAAISQDLTGLEVGRKYQLVAPVVADVVEDYQDGVKIAPTFKPDAGQVRLGAGPTGASFRDETAIAYSGWWTGATVPDFYYQYQVYIYEFTATQENMTIWVEVRSTYPYPNNGFFMDAIGLYALDEVDQTVASVATVDPFAPTSTPFPTPTPRPDGAIIHVVQAGDTFWVIANQYASALGVSPEEALDIIRELNNDPAFINVGQELLIAPAADGLTPVETTEDTTTTDDTATEDTTDATTEESTASDETTDTVEDEAVTEEEVAAEETDSAESSLSVEEEAVDDDEAMEETGDTAVAQGGSTDDPQATTGVICVSAFEDVSGDGSFDSGAESLLAGAALTLSRGGATVSTYVSDGVTERHCFEELDPDTYQIQFFPPADYRATTQDNGWMAVAAGAAMPVAFGAQFNPEPEAVEEVASVATPVTEATDETTDRTGEEAPAEEGNFFTDNLGAVIIGVAILLVLLAVVGVVLLRRG